MSREADNLATALLALFEARTGIDLSRDETAMKRIREASEKAHQEWLVIRSGLEINLPFIAPNGAGAHHLEASFGHADAGRVFAGEELSSKMMAEAREARASAERALDATRLVERKMEEAEAADRAQTRKIVVVVSLIILAFFVSIIASAFTRHHEAEPRDRTHERAH